MVYGEYFVPILSDTQQNLIDAVSTLVAVCSATASFRLLWILNVVRGDTSSSSPPAPTVRRFLTHMSILDIFTSLYYGLSFVWNEQPMVPGPLCTFRLIINIPPLMIFYLNVALSFFYSLTIRDKCRPTVFAKRYEALGHALPYLVLVPLAISAIVTDSINPNSVIPGCSVKMYPPDCLDDDNEQECIRGSEFIVVYLYDSMAFLSIIFVFLSQVINQTLIFCYVRNIEKRIARFIVHSSSDISKTRAVGTQSLFYVLACFFVIFGLVFSTFIDEDMDASTVFLLTLIRSFVYPGQGLWTFLVFRRPRWVAACRARRQKKEARQQQASSQTQSTTLDAPASPDQQQRQSLDIIKNDNTDNKGYGEDDLTETHAEEEKEEL